MSWVNSSLSGYSWFQPRIKRGTTVQRQRLLKIAFSNNRTGKRFILRKFANEQDSISSIIDTRRINYFSTKYRPHLKQQIDQFQNRNETGLGPQPTEEEVDPYLTMTVENKEYDDEQRDLDEKSAYFIMNIMTPMMYNSVINSVEKYYANHQKKKHWKIHTVHKLGPHKGRKSDNEIPDFTTNVTKNDKYWQFFGFLAGYFKSTAIAAEQHTESPFKSEYPHYLILIESDKTYTKRLTNQQSNDHDWRKACLIPISAYNPQGVGERHYGISTFDDLDKLVSFDGKLTEIELTRASVVNFAWYQAIAISQYLTTPGNKRTGTSGILRWIRSSEFAQLHKLKNFHKEKQTEEKAQKKRQKRNTNTKRQKMNAPTPTETDLQLQKIGIQMKQPRMQHIFTSGSNIHSTNSLIFPLIPRTINWYTDVETLYKKITADVINYESPIQDDDDDDKQQHDDDDKQRKNKQNDDDDDDDTQNDSPNYQYDDEDSSLEPMTVDEPNEDNANKDSNNDANNDANNGSWAHLFDYIKHMDLKKNYHCHRFNGWFKMMPSEEPDKYEQDWIVPFWTNNINPRDEIKYPEDEPLILYLRLGLVKHKPFREQLLNSWVWNAYKWYSYPKTRQEFNNMTLISYRQNIESSSPIPQPPTSPTPQQPAPQSQQSQPQQLDLPPQSQPQSRPKPPKKKKKKK